MKLVLSLFFAVVAVAEQQPPPKPNQQQRDLKLERIDENSSLPKATTIPRSYAVIVGISAYQNLPANLQLRYAERDAQSVFTTLISPEGGNFKAENVHLITGPKATLAALRREITDWLSGVAKEGDRVLVY